MKTLFNKRVTILRKISSISDGMMGAEEYWGIHLGNVACSVGSISAEERLAYGKENYVLTHRLRCASIDVKPTDRVVYGTSTYNILSISTLRDGHMSILLGTSK